MSAKTTQLLATMVAGYLAYRWFTSAPAATPATVPTGSAPANARTDALSPLLQSLAVVGRNFFDPPPSAGPVVPIPGFIP